MELEKNFIHKNELIASAYAQATVEDDYNLPDYKPDLMKMIDAVGEVELEETKVGSQSVFVQGKLKFSVLYRGESGEKRISSLQGEIPFREKINMDGVEELDPVTVRAEAADLGISVINSRKISLRCVLEFQAECRVMSDTAVPVAVPDGTDYEVKMSDRQVLQLLENRRDVLRMRQELSLPKEKPNGSELIWSVVDFEGANFRLTSDGVEIAGTARLCLLYQGMEDAAFAWYETSTAVSGILPCRMFAQAEHYQVKICGVRPLVELREDSDGEMRLISVDLSLEVEISLWNEEEISFVEDLYSLTGELEVERKPETLEQMLIKNSGKTKVSGEMTLDELEEAMYLCSGHSRVRIRRKEIVEKGVEVEGDLTVDALYLTGDEDLPLGCARRTFPFTQILEAEGIDENSLVDLEAGVEQLQLTLSDGHHAAVRGEIQLNMMVFSREELPMIQRVEEREPDEQALQESPGMVGYIVQKGDSLWKIAKENHTTVDNLREINSLEEDAIFPGQKLLIVKSVPLP